MDTFAINRCALLNMGIGIKRFIHVYLEIYVQTKTNIGHSTFIPKYRCPFRLDLWNPYTYHLFTHSTKHCLLRTQSNCLPHRIRRGRNQTITHMVSQNEKKQRKCWGWWCLSKEFSLLTWDTDQTTCMKCCLHAWLCFQLNTCPIV